MLHLPVIITPLRTYLYGHTGFWMEVIYLQHLLIEYLEIYIFFENCQCELYFYRREIDMHFLCQHLFADVKWSELERLSIYKCMLIFILPSENDCVLTPEENLEPISAGLKNSRTRGVWHKSLEESHTDQIKERSLLGHILWSEETQKKILELDIFRILESVGVTEIGALYKVFPSKFVLVFGSKLTKEKLSGTEIQCRFDDSEICLNFHKRVGPLRDGREPIFATIFLSEFSDQAVRSAFSNSGKVVSVFKGRHRFKRDVRNGKKAGNYS